MTGEEIIEKITAQAKCPNRYENAIIDFEVSMVEGNAKVTGCACIRYDEKTKKCAETNSICDYFKDDGLIKLLNTVKRPIQYVINNNNNSILKEIQEDIEKIKKSIQSQ